MQNSLNRLTNLKPHRGRRFDVSASLSWLIVTNMKRVRLTVYYRRDSRPYLQLSRPSHFIACRTKFHGWSLEMSATSDRDDLSIDPLAILTAEKGDHASHILR